MRLQAHCRQLGDANSSNYLPLQQLAITITHCIHRHLKSEVQPPRAPCTSPGAPVARLTLCTPLSTHTLAAAPEAQAEPTQGCHEPQRRTCQQSHRLTPCSAFSGDLRAQPLHMLGPHLLHRAPLPENSAHCVTAQPAVCPWRMLPHLQDFAPEL